MNVLFFSLIRIRSIKEPGIYTDLLREFSKHKHNVYIISAEEEKSAQEISSEEQNTYIIPVYVGKIQKTNVIKKGINTLFVNERIKTVIRKKLGDIKIDLVLYATPPVTISNFISYIKNRDGAKSYLMLKDIHPQGAVDLGALNKKGFSSFIYKYFRRKEQKLYAVSDRIGCMSPTNIEYLLKHNPEISPEKVKLCPNSIEVQDMSLSAEEKISMREKYCLPPDKTIFVYGGNLGKPQGMPFIIECLKSQMDNPDAYYLIVGSGTEYNKLESFFTQTKPSNIRLMKSISKNDYDRMVAACDAGMIFLDHRFTIPNFPSRLLSYMQAKLPVLACTDPNTDIGKVIVDGGFGWWCESNDVEAFVRIVKESLCADRNAMGEKAYKYLSDNWDVKKQYSKIISSINKI